MFTNRLFYLLIVIALFAVTACAPVATPAQEELVTLRFAIADAEERPSTPYVHEFVDQVKTLSNGKMTIEPVWDAGAPTEAGFEVGVVQLLTEGQADLGLAGSRAFDVEGITSFQALQAPFLITNDNLSKAVATSDIATQMLDSLPSNGVVGLTMWPEDLRHPFSVVPDKPILSSDDFEGASVRVVPSEVSHMLIETLGGTPTFEDDYQAAESGLRQGFSLTGTPTATGNIIFFAKFQVLFANGAAFEKLSESQQNILRQAAIATQKKAIAEHPREIEAATAWCADGGTIVLASDEQIAAFEKAAQPVIDKISQNPLNAELIASIRELKAKAEPALGAEACGPIGLPIPQPTESAQSWSEGLPPNGVWQAEITTDDFVRMGVLRSVAAAEWAGVYTITFEDGKYVMIWDGLQGQLGRCQAKYELVGEIVRLTLTSEPSECSWDHPDDIRWRIDDEGLHLHLVPQNSGFVEVESTAFYEAKPWQNVEEWSAGLLPNGVWQVELSAEDIAQFGVLPSTATDMAGTYTWTFQDGDAKIEINGPNITVSCMMVATVIEDVVRLQNVGSPTCDGNAYDDVQWRLDADGLRFRLVSSQAVELKTMYESKPWQKIANQ